MVMTPGISACGAGAAFFSALALFFSTFSADNLEFTGLVRYVPLTVAVFFNFLLTERNAVQIKLKLFTVGINCYNHLFALKTL